MRQLCVETIHRINKLLVNVRMARFSKRCYQILLLLARGVFLVCRDSEIERKKEGKCILWWFSGWNMVMYANINIFDTSRCSCIIVRDEFINLIIAMINLATMNNKKRNEMKFNLKRHLLNLEYLPGIHINRAVWMWLCDSLSLQKENCIVNNIKVAMHRA